MNTQATNNRDNRIAFFIADIPGMNDKSRLFIPGIVMHIIHPVCMIFRIKYLCISNMNIPVGAVFTNPSTVRDQTEIITGRFLFYFMIMTVNVLYPEGVVMKIKRSRS